MDQVAGHIQKIGKQVHEFVFFCAGYCRAQAFSTVDLMPAHLAGQLG